VALAVAAVALVAYLTTLAPTITWSHSGADGGDLITAAATDGVPHPTGYPTYLLLAKPFLLLPWGDLAWRLNLMSAVFASLSVGLLYLSAIRTLRMLGNRAIAVQHHIVAAAAALAFAFSPVLWSQAVITEVYALNAAFFSLILYLVLSWMENRRPLSLLLAGAAFGFGLGNHLTLVLAVPGIALLFLLWPRLLPDRRWLLLALSVASLLGLSIYALLPIRASQAPPVNWGDPRTVGRFIWLVTGRLYRRYSFNLPLRYLLARLAAWARLLAHQFGSWGLFIGLAGVWSLWEKARHFAAACVVMAATYSVYAIGYDTSDSHVYLIPTFLVFALWLAWGLDWLLAIIQPLITPVSPQVVRGAAVSLALVIPLVSFIGNRASVDVSSDFVARDYGLSVMQNVQPEAVVITQTDAHGFTLNYYRYAKKKRLDVALLDEQLLYHDWYRQHLPRIHSRIALPDRTVFLSGGTTMCPTSLLVAAIEANRARFPVYLTDPDAELRACYALSQEGDVYRVTGRRDG
jgi:hypothetical protein